MLRIAGHEPVMRDDRGSGALIYYSVFNVFALTCPYYTWRRLTRLGRSLDTSITSHAERERLADWLSRHSRRPRQIARCGVIAGACLGGLRLIVEPIVGDDIAIGVASYLAVAIAACVGWEDFYWVWHLPLLVREVCRSPDLKLYWYAPAETPAVEGLSRLLGWTAVLGVIGGAMVAVSVAYGYSLSGTSTVLILGLVAGAITSATLVFTGIYSQLLLFREVSQAKERTLRAMDEKIGELATDDPEVQVADQLRWVALRQAVSQSPSWTLRNETIVQYLAATIGVLATVVLTLFVGSR